MSGKKLFMAMIFLLLLFSVPALNAQVNQEAQKDKGMGMRSDLMNCMNQIAADSTMRTQMVTRMMDNMRGDSTAMKQFCKKMMDNPEMRDMMMRVMHEGAQGMGGMMKKHNETDTLVNLQHR